MNEKEYRALKLQIDAELNVATQKHAADIAALERTFQLSNKFQTNGTKPESAAPTLLQTGTADLRRGELTRIVEDIVKTMRGDIVIKNVMGLVWGKVPDARQPSVTIILQKLAENKVLEVISEGTGNKPTIYRKK